MTVNFTICIRLGGFSFNVIWSNLEEIYGPNTLMSQLSNSCIPTGSNWCESDRWTIKIYCSKISFMVEFEDWGDRQQNTKRLSSDCCNLDWREVGRQKLLSRTQSGVCIFFCVFSFSFPPSSSNSQTHSKTDVTEANWLHDSNSGDNSSPLVKSSTFVMCFMWCISLKVSSLLQTKK